MSSAGEVSEGYVLQTESGLPGRRKVSLGSERPFGRTTVIDGIVAEIRTQIAAGELKDGDTLPSQDEMARTLGVSRASLREALNRLALMGLIEIRHGRGTYVRTARPHDLMNSLSALLILDKVSAGELLEARFHVESALAALAAMNATDEDLARIQQLIVRMEKDPKAKDIDGFVPFDTQLHLAFAQASKNPVLVKVLEVVWSVLPQRIRHITTPEQIPTFLAFHREILEALSHHDPAAARLAMEHHVRYLIDLNEHIKPAANHG